MTELFQLQAFTIKGSIKQRQFFDLFHLVGELYSSSTDSSSADLDKEFKECVQSLIEAFLEGIRSVGALITLYEDWVRKNHATLMSSKQTGVPPAVDPESGANEAALLLPAKDAGQLPDAMMFGDPKAYAAKKQAIKNQRHIELFFNSAESFLATIEGFLEAI